MRRRIVFIGGGLPSLLMAKLCRQKFANAEITIIERAPVVGGQYGSFHYGEFGEFDHGIHLLYDTGVEEIDATLRSMLPDGRWLIHEGNEKDIAGIYYNGRLQRDTPYVDLRNLPDNARQRYIGELIDTASESRDAEPQNCHELLLARFGGGIANEVMAPIVRKLFGKDAAELDPSAAKLLALDRVALFECDVMRDLMKSDFIRSRIAYPDQMTLPKIRTFEQKAYYPKTYGLGKLMGEFESQLAGMDIEILKNTHVEGIGAIEEGMVSLKLNSGRELERSKIFWAAGLPPLVKLLAPSYLSSAKFDVGLRNVYVNFLFPEAPDMGRLYYFYCFDGGLSTFRVSSHANYCPAASAGGRGYPVCVEMHLPADKAGARDEDLLRSAREELQTLGVVDGAAACRFGKAERPAGSGIVQPTLNNMRIVEEMRSICEQEAGGAIIPVGVFSKKNLFFSKDVLVDFHHEIQKSLA